VGAIKALGPRAPKDCRRRDQQLHAGRDSLFMCLLLGIVKNEQVERRGDCGRAEMQGVSC
jgi:hypothetical protein